MLPRACRDHLIVQELAGETLVYDLDHHKAHCLNQAAALVWRHCDGKTTVAGIASILCRQHGLAADEKLVWQALHELGRARLVQANKPAAGRVAISRRQMARRLALAVIAAPLVTTILAPSTAMAASCGGKNAPCGPGLPPCCPAFTCKIGKCHEHGNLPKKR